MNKTITIIIILHFSLFTFHSKLNAQLPNFTKVDTGAMTELWGGHVSSTCFDMDNDGDLDIACNNSGVYASRVFSLYKNERNGLYIKMPEFAGTLRRVSSIGDINNDGAIDLIMGQGFGGDKVFVFTNNGYGTFQLDVMFYLWYETYYRTVLDINNDGFLDVLGIDLEGSVALNNGNGGFPETTGLGIFQEQSNIYLHGVSWGDLDDNGYLDFFGGYTSSGGSNPLNVCHLNYGDGDFEKFDETSPIVESSCTTPCANWLDYDNDGDMDLFVIDFGCNNSLPALYENLGDLQFTRHDIIDEIYRYSFTNSSVWGDLDNDADLDLFISIENNEFPWGGGTSATPYNVIYLNNGNGQFTNIQEHTLTLEDSHTALLLDHDNDGDLDVLMTRYSWSNDGYNNLFVNEGNENSWIILTCEGTLSNRSAIGARVQAKALVNGNHITQTREVTPINGHLSYANLRIHFGLGETDIIDTLLIRWPSGHIDEYLNVEAKQFYRAIEADELVIDFKATNYIQYNPPIPTLYFAPGETRTIDLNKHYSLIEGDTVPSITGDTLTFSLFSNENPGVVQARITDKKLILNADSAGETTIKIKASANAISTARVDEFAVHVGVGLKDQESINNATIFISPNPCSDALHLRYHLPRHRRGIKDTRYLISDIYSISGIHIRRLLNEVKAPGEYEMEVDMSELPPGVYFFVLKTDDAVFTEKVVKL